MHAAASPACMAPPRPRGAAPAMIETLQTKLLFVIGAVSIVTSVYVFHFKAKEIRRHNRRLRSYIFAVRRATLKATVVTAIGYVIQWMDRLYGRVAGDEFRDFLNARSLRVSVAVVITYVIFIPYLLMGYWLMKASGSVFVWFAVPAIAFASFRVLIHFVWRYALENYSLRENIRHFGAMLVLQFALIAAGYAAFDIAARLTGLPLRPEAPLGTLMIFCAASLYAVTVAYLYVRFIFLSIFYILTYSIAVVVALVAAAYFIPFVLELSLVVSSPPLSLLPVRIGATCITLLLLALPWLLWNRRFGALAAVGIACLVYVNYWYHGLAFSPALEFTRLISAGGAAPLEPVKLPEIGAGFWRSIYMVSFAYWVLFGSIYLVIFANCYTDLFSVAVSRFIFRKVHSTRQSGPHLLGWLLLDVLIAVFIFTATMLVFQTAMDLQMRLAAYTATIAESTAVAGVENMRIFFLDIYHYYRIIVGALFGGDFAYLHSLAANAIRHSENFYLGTTFFISLSVVMFTFTPLVPTIVNMTLIALSIVHGYLSIFLVMYLRRLHSLVLMRPKDDAYRSQEAVRSILLFSILASVSLLVLIESFGLAVTAASAFAGRAAPE